MRFKYYYAQRKGYLDSHSIRAQLRSTVVKTIGAKAGGYGPIVKVMFDATPHQALFSGMGETRIPEEQGAVDAHWRSKGCKCAGVSWKHEPGRPFIGPDSEQLMCQG
jgi:hypothetical protein